jgi:superfamily II DNA or RNA helicase
LIKYLNNIDRIDDGLREYQKEYKYKVYKLWEQHQSLMLQLPTGTGKTRIFASIVY